MPPKSKAAGKGRAPAKRKLAEEFPPGEVLTDTGKKAWKLGAPIGQGGFGLIYLADENSAKPVGEDARYVIKVEPSDNGPLFSELKFYMRAAKPDLIQSWMKSHKLKSLGVPRYWGSGLHERDGGRYRFMVVDRLGTDLQKKFEECGRRFPRKLVLQLGLRLLDILEYIHEHEYVHADIKASNLVLSHSDPNQVYLVDYGLAYRYAPDSVLKEYKEDPKRCHDGTIEFTSIDAHKGASASRRSDLEILCYCMVQWLCGRLPWEDKLQDPLYVRDSKLRSQENISEFMTKCFSPQDKPDEIQRFMEEVKSLGYQDKPPYDKLRSILQAGLKAIQAKDDGKLEFTPVSGAVSTPTKKTTKRKKAADEAGESETEGSLIKKKRVTKKKEVNGVKKNTKKTPIPRKAPSTGKQGDPKSRLVEMGTQTSPGLAQRTRGRTKTTNS
ncbi:serine/threonine-protein kinase VRK1 isoform X1 [Micropterus dolomieu]|uniref:serine/threonine-protein kinase VRK1 isoform X1 n=1 Tax=Micropterus dolomieu TaxID=147949 RepID=UPI001E8EE45D|nr:serine/threonine-protein kinase VRK1 isoform X1 [Micropterus dolomieu]XP_045919118.1 serine/threonine-protein kinase VRK1 isoform X1 [Micropterus dolomieu]